MARVRQQGPVLEQLEGDHDDDHVQGTGHEVLSSVQQHHDCNVPVRRHRTNPCHGADEQAGSSALQGPSHRPRLDREQEQRRSQICARRDEEYRAEVDRMEQHCAEQRAEEHACTLDHRQSKVRRGQLSRRPRELGKQGVLHRPHQSRDRGFDRDKRVHPPRCRAGQDHASGAAKAAALASPPRNRSVSIRKRAISEPANGAATAAGPRRTIAATATPAVPDDRYANTANVTV